MKIILRLNTIFFSFSVLFSRGNMWMCNSISPVSCFSSSSFLFLSRRGIFITCQCFGHNSLVVIYHCEERKFNRSRRDNHTNAKQNPWQQKEIEKKKICRFGMGARARMRLKNCNENNSLKWCAFAFARCCKMNSYSLRRHRHHHHHCSQIGDVLFRFH